MSNKDDAQDQAIRHLSVLVEHVIGQNQAVLEAVSDMQQHVRRIPYIEERVEELTQDMKAVKAAIKATNQDVQRLEVRVSRLEAAA